MRICARITTWWRLSFHLMGRLAHGEFHIEACHTEGLEVAGVYIGYRFIQRYCATCGYLKGDL